MDVVASGGDPSKVQEITPYLISVLWGSKAINCDSIGEF